ncbi:MAG: hypothetical protein WA213_12635 [Terriglobales bacterium]
MKRKEGATWVLRYRVTASDGRRVENIMQVGLVRDFPKEKDAWHEVDKLGLPVRINEDPCVGRIRFSSLAEHYLKADFGADAVRPKSVNTIPIVEHYVRDYLVKRFGEAIAEEIKPLEIQKWLKSLNETNGLAWTTIAKIRGLMLRIYKIGLRHEESCAARRDAFQVHLPGDHHHPGPNADHTQVSPLPAPLRTGAHLCGDRAALVGDSGAALGGRAVVRRKDSRIEAMGQG